MFEQKPLVNVTDLSRYLYCPRQFYLEKIKGIKKPVTKEMVEGRIRHEVLDLFSRNEREIIDSIEKTSNIETSYLEFLRKIIALILKENKGGINEFKISEKELIEKIEKQITKEIKLRVSSIKDALEKGFEKEEIWDNLEPKYYSEFSINSVSLGLKGRIDRLVLEKDKIIPFELKTREIQKVYESDEIQVVAYSLLVEDYFDKKVEFGIIESGNEKFQIEIDDKRRKKVIELIKEIQSGLSKKYPSNFSKCEKCSYKKECDEL